MWEDPIVQEVREARAKHAEQFNFDLRAIYEDFKRQEQQSGGRFVSFPPRRIQPIPVEADLQDQEPQIGCSEIEIEEVFDKKESGAYQKNQTVTIKVPEVIAEQYQTQEELRQSIYESMIIREFQKGMLTIRECAQILGLTYEGYIDWLGARKLSFITATPQELEESYNNFEKFMESHQTESLIRDDR